MSARRTFRQYRRPGSAIHLLVRLQIVQPQWGLAQARPNDITCPTKINKIAANQKIL